MRGNGTTLGRARGIISQPLPEVFRVLLGQSPNLVWCEPLPERERVRGFQGLWSAPCEGLKPFLEPDRVILEEARLFWDGGGAHLLARGGKSAWAAFWQDGGDPPAWLSPLRESQEKQETLDDLSRSEDDVLTQRDWERYGLPTPTQEFPSRLRMTTYRLGTELVHWHLKEIAP